MNKYGSNATNENGDIETPYDRALLLKKIKQALLESEKDLGQDWEEFKIEFLKEDF